MNAVAEQQRLMDGVAIGASGLCLVHCLLVPALLLALPTLGAYLAIPEEFHFWALLIAVPTSLLALLFGFPHHRRLSPATFALTGIALLIIAEIAFHDSPLEIWVTVPGSLLLAAGHILNLRFARPDASLADH